MPPQTCLVRGSINIDEFFSVPHIARPGETLASTAVARRTGGKGANQACAVARAGGRVLLDGHVGADGRAILAELAEAGVGVDRLGVVEGEVTGRAIIQSSADGENTIILHAGANFHVPTPARAPALDGITHLLVQNEVPLAETVAYVEAARAAGAVTVLNPSPMLADPRAFPWAALDYLVVNEGELRDVALALGCAAPAAAGACDAGDAVARAMADVRALRDSAAFGAATVVCTLGARGVLVLAPGEAAVHMPAAELRRPLVDTTGAGDCFAGYFVAGLMRRAEAGGAAARTRGEVEELCRLPLVACSICVERSGAMESIPGIDEVRARAA